MNKLPDNELIPLLKSGNEKAFRVLFDRYHVQLYYLAKRYLKKPELAEDAVQDVFVKLWEQRFILDDTKSVKGFLFTILRNHVLNMIRKRYREILLTIDGYADELPQRNSHVDDKVYEEIEKVLEAGLDELSERKREVFEMKTVNGFTNSEIADLLKIDIRTVKTHYYTSSRFIKDYLRNHAGITGFLVVVIASSLIFYF